MRVKNKALLGDNKDENLVEEENGLKISNTCYTIHCCQLSIFDLRIRDTL